MENITLEVSPQEAAAIISVLGDLPTKTGAYELFVKLSRQVETQVKPSDGSAAE